MALLDSASAKMRLRFFSVSPMYLLTTVERSILYASSSSARAMISTAIVLPVPEGPRTGAVPNPPARPPEAPVGEDALAARDALAISRSRRATGAGSTKCVPLEVLLEPLGERGDRSVGGFACRSAQQLGG